MGFMITIEGSDGSGKQTQAHKLYERLKNEGYNVMLQSFPNYLSPACGGVKMYLSGEFGENDTCFDAYQASVLYSVDRLCTYNRDLKDFYENGGIIILDRYIESNMIHQAGKILDKNKLDAFLDWLIDFEHNKLKIPMANKVIFLNVPPEISKALANARTTLKAGTSKDIHEKSKDHLQRAFKAGMYVGQKFNWSIINCVKDNKMRSIDDIHTDIYDTVINDINSYGL